jgi:hypothetical protein
VNLATATDPLEASEVDALMHECPLRWVLHRQTVAVPLTPPAVSFDSLKKLGAALRSRKC